MPEAASCLFIENNFADGKVHRAAACAGNVSLERREFQVGGWRDGVMLGVALLFEFVLYQDLAVL